MFSDDAKAIIALTTRLGPGPRRSLSPSKWHRLSQALSDGGLRPADVFNPHGAAVPGLAQEDAEAVGDLVASAGSALLEADELARKGIWILTLADADYPAALNQRLGTNAPPVIFGAGDESLLSRPAVGIVGSRDVDEAGAEVARLMAAEAVRLGRLVVSGGARGVDQLAMNAAYQAQGDVVGVLADSLLGRIRKSDTLIALDRGGTCLISQQAPNAGFSPASAMARNKLIYALSDVTVVVASSSGSGGTWAGATEALKSKNGTVAVWRGPGEGDGNAELESAGAKPLTSAAGLEERLAAELRADTEQLSLRLTP